MHNCKLTRRDFIDLALDEMPEPKATELLVELNNCETCQVEFATLRTTLHVSSQALRSALPAEEFWPGYHSRLHSKLLTNEAQQTNTGTHNLSFPVSLSSQLWLTLSRMATTSLRVPVPVALGLLLLLGVSFLALRSRGQVNVTPLTPVALVETKTVEVPVIQEKVITRVVYVDKKGDKSRQKAKGSDRKEIPTAVTGSDPAATTAMSLAGFKPTDEVKLTVIKGSYKDEKR